MKINESKSNFIIFSRCQTAFTTRLIINSKTIEQVRAIKLLGVWITEDLTWQRNCQELCKKAYARVSMLTKLKYVGTSKDDLLTVYKLFIRSCLEYCSVVFHSSLTMEQTNMLERCQKVCLKLIFTSEYTDYQSALVLANIPSLFDRREKRVLDFSTRALKHPRHKQLFPVSNKFTENTHNIRQTEKFTVNFANTNAYKNSFVPYAQRKLNEEVKKQTSAHSAQ